MFKTCQFWKCFWQCFLPIFILKTLSETFPKLTKLKYLDYLFKRAAMVSNFCLMETGDRSRCDPETPSLSPASIGKIWHNFLVPRMIEGFHAYSDLRSTQSDSALRPENDFQKWITHIADIYIPLSEVVCISTALTECFDQN